RPSYESAVHAEAEFKDDIEHKIEEKAKSTLQEAADAIKPDCKSADKEIATGPTAMMIEEVVRDENFDLTVLTPSSHSALQKLFLGSVTSNVLKHVVGSVLICRPSEKP